MQIHLTKTSIAKLKPPQTGDSVFWDTQCQRFGIRVFPSGAKTFVIQYRNESGRSRRKTVGKFPALTVHKARVLAQRELGRVAFGEDPVGERETRRDELTVGDLADRFLKEYVAIHHRPRTAQEARRIIKKHLVPTLGRIALSDIAHNDVAKLHTRLKKTPVHANRVVKVAHTMFGFAKNSDLVPDSFVNPAARIKKFKERKRDRHLSVEEFSALGNAIDERERSGKISPVAASAIRFLALTGLRVGETLQLRWVDIDFNRQRIWLRETKTEPRGVVINSSAQAVLLALQKKTSGSVWVFPGRVYRQPMVNLAKPWGLVRTSAKLEGVRLHDLRHSFASVGVAGQLGLPIVGALLGHNQPQTTNRYAHLADDPLRQATEGIGKTIGAALAGDGNQPQESTINEANENPPLN